MPVTSRTPNETPVERADPARTLVSHLQARVEQLRARLLKVSLDALTGYAKYHEDCDRADYVWMDIMVSSRLHCTLRARFFDIAHLRSAAMVESRRQKPRAEAKSNGRKRKQSPTSASPFAVLFVHHY